MYMKLTWTTILIFDVHFDVQFNGTPQIRDAVLILNHSFICIISLVFIRQKALVVIAFQSLQLPLGLNYLHLNCIRQMNIVIIYLISTTR